MGVSSKQQGTFMQLTFLSAAVPLTKTIAFSARDNQYTTAPYPMVSRVSSHLETVKNTHEFAEALRKHAKLGHCLMKGGFDRLLTDESRAGHSVNETHEWVCFDFDKIDCPPTMDGALVAIGKYLPSVCKNTEAIIQLSSSCFNPQTKKLSAHIFMVLDKPLTTEQLSEWLTSLNFTEPLLSELRLSDSAIALSWPLDRSVAHPSKLLYITAPACIGFEPPIKAQGAIAHVPGAHPKLKVPYFTNVPRETQHAQINALRTKISLPTREYLTSMHRDQEILREPGDCVIHGLRRSGADFLRFNLNGGDSMGYFINLREPHLIGNFKGEPYLYTVEANETFYKGLTKSLAAMPQQPRGSDGMEVLAFYATNRGSKIFVGTYDRGKDILRVDQSADGAADSWLQQFGVPLQANLPHYDLVHDIQSNIRYEEGYPVINLYARTDFIKQYADLDRVLSLEGVLPRLEEECPVIYKTMKSMTGDDERSLLGFINWFAYIFQTRKKTDTAWLLHGIQGTGKGKFLECVARPLLGQSNTVQILMNSVDSRFNSMLEGKILCNIDECAMTRTRDKVESMSKLKNWITEPTIFINEKGIVEREVPSFINFIFTSNDLRPLVIESEDRRFHVARRQPVRLQYLINEYARLEQGEELPQFAKTLGELIVDHVWVRNPDANEFKAQLFESTHSLVDRVGQAITEGDTQFFVEGRPDDIQLQTSSSSTLLPIREYDALVHYMISGHLNVLTRADLYVLFQVVVNDSKHFPDNPTEQKRIYQRFNLLPGPRDSHYDKRTNKSSYGVKAPAWRELPEAVIFTPTPPEMPNDGTVVPIRKKPGKAK